ncbi:pentapeptide repeat-containing protein [Nioella aestuarii]|uniref:pentapeptide repeat-containing protein n=1 Tax=Nioella aestuarii TaxID=1662864 RepID=UPI003D7F7F0C
MGADLTCAEMQGADFRGAKMSECTYLTAATLRGADVRYVNETTIAQLRDHWGDIFADGKVQVPERARPEHWADDELSWSYFRSRWHAWQETLLDFDPSWRGE